MKDYEKFPQRESYLYVLMIGYITGKSKKLIAKLVSFCAECLSLFVFKETPVIRINHFMSSEIFALYLKNDRELSEIVFHYLLLKDEQWLRFINIPLFIFCNAFISLQDEDENSAEYYRTILGDNFHRLKRTLNNKGNQISEIFYMAFGSYNVKNYNWEGCMYRMFEEIAPFLFNSTYIQALIKGYLDKLGNENDDSKVLKHISLCEPQLEYDENGEQSSVTITVDDALCMCEHLSIIEDVQVFPEKVPKNILKSLAKEKNICTKKDGKWNILLHKIGDIDVIKKMSIYDEVLQLINSIEAVYLKFLNGDYSEI